jgi:hypothetical protein
VYSLDLHSAQHDPITVLDVIDDHRITVQCAYEVVAFDVSHKHPHQAAFTQALTQACQNTPTPQNPNKLQLAFDNPPPAAQVPVSVTFSDDLPSFESSLSLEQATAVYTEYPVNTTYKKMYQIVQLPIAKTARMPVLRTWLLPLR